MLISKGLGVIAIVVKGPGAILEVFIEQWCYNLVQIRSNVKIYPVFKMLITPFGAGVPTWFLQL